MTNRRVRDLTAGSALTGTEKFYADNGTTDTYVTSEQIADFVGREGGRYIDIRDFGDISDGDITVALQATLDYVRDTADNFSYTPSILVPYGDDPDVSYSVGNIDFPEDINLEVVLAGNGYALFLQEGVTLHLKSGNCLRGAVWQRSSPQTTFPYSAIVPSETSNPAILLSQGNNVVENIRCNPDYPNQIGFHVTDLGPGPTALIHFKHCSGQGINDATSIPFKCDSCFWIWMDYCVFGSVATFPVQFTTDVDANQTMGLVQCRNLHLENNGVLIKAKYASCDNMQFHDTQSENFTGGSMFNFDTTEAEILENNAEIKDIEIIRPQIFDSGDPVIKVLGNRVSSISVYQRGVDHAIIDDDSTGPIGNLVDISHKVSPLGIEGGLTPASPSYIPITKQEFANSIDTALISAPRAPQWVPFTPLSVLQDPADWVDDPPAVVTTGILAPDGSTMAGAVAGDNGDIFLYETAHTVTVGDWFIVGCWTQGSTDHPPQPLVLDLSHWTGSGVGAAMNGSLTEVNNNGRFYITDYGSDRIIDGGWKWSYATVKVTALGTGDLIVQVRISPEGGDCADPSNYFNPCLYYIPVSAGWSDGDILAAARSCKGGWSTNAKAGEVAILDHQKFRSGTALMLTDGVTAPGTVAGAAQIYVDTADGDLKVKFGDGTVKVIVADT